jgi:putative membrane protein
MASVRTSVSLIGFGFTVAQFFEKLRAKVPPEMRVEPDVSRDLGLLLIGAGVISLVLFTWRYHAALVYLRTGDFAVLATPEARPLHRPTYIVALTVIFIGVAAFVSVFMRF